LFFSSLPNTKTHRLHGKRVLVTAAAQGIGRATAVKFAQEGAVVYATDINETKLSELKTVHGIRTQKLDVTSKRDIEEIIKQIGDLNVLVNAAGYVPNGTILQCEEKDWDFTFDINVKSMYRIIKAVLPSMIAAKNGSIVNIASIASSVKGLPNRFAYGASKAAVIGLTKAVAIDHIKEGVRCNAICPGTIHTPSLDDRISVFSDPVAAREAFTVRQPIGRLGTPEEIAEIALYLASDAAGFTTGTVMIVDGGFTL